MRTPDFQTPPAEIAARTAEMGHDDLVPLPGAFAPAFKCPTCDARAEWSSSGWSGWTLDFTHDQVIGATRPKES